MTDPFAQMKDAHRLAWASFAPIDVHTTRAAPHLVRFAGVGPGQRVLDVGCGTGVVAITAARAGATVTGADLTPALLERAREHAATARVDVPFIEADAEALPFGDASFDVVLSQFGHMFAPRPEVCVSELLRVLKPGGVLAFSTWPPEGLAGQLFTLTARYMPPPPGAAQPAAWGDPEVVRARLGDAVESLTFERATMAFGALSVFHWRTTLEATGPMGRAASTLPPDRMEALRAEVEALVHPFYWDNTVHQEFLMSRAIKRA